MLVSPLHNKSDASGPRMFDNVGERLLREAVNGGFDVTRNSPVGEAGAVKVNRRR